MDKKNKLSVVIPVYKAEDCLMELYRRLVATLTKTTKDFEIILVEDCGGDNSWMVIQTLAKKDNRIKGLQLSRNFGQHAAITAGLEAASGDYIVVMDCDLQDRPEEIVRFYSKVLEGYDLVLGRRVKRKDKFFKRLGSKIFWKLYDMLTNQKSDETIANFGIYSKKVIQSCLKLKEQHRNFPLAIRWLGFKYAKIDIQHHHRLTGKSSYTFSKLLSFGIDSIISYSNKPLKYMVGFGFLISFISFIYGIIIIIKYLHNGSIAVGWTSLIVSLYFLGGVIIFSLGILGIYIDKVFNETKARPLYIISNELNLNKKNDQK